MSIKRTIMNGSFSGIGVDRANAIADPGYSRVLVLNGWKSEKWKSLTVQSHGQDNQSPAPSLEV
ncbi:MAG: hypothetical protein ACLFR0_00885 [Alphaproteobacteria bacterium]